MVDESEVRGEFEDGEEGRVFSDVVVDVFVAGKVAEWGRRRRCGSGRRA